jgi:hypothetical protein
VLIRVPPGWTSESEGYYLNTEALSSLAAASKTYRLERDAWEKAYYELSDKAERFRGTVEAQISELRLQLEEERGAWRVAVCDPQSPFSGLRRVRGGGLFRWWRNKRRRRRSDWCGKYFDYLRDVVRLQGLSELSSLFGFIAVVISVAVGVGTLRQRANEPNEKRWNELEGRWEAFEKWKDGVDDKLDRDYRSINRAGKKIDRHQDFERIMLRSMLGIIEHLATGNHTEKLQDISEQINEYLINDRQWDLSDDVEASSRLSCPR